MPVENDEMNMSFVKPPEELFRFLIDRSLGRASGWSASGFGDSVKENKMLKYTSKAVKVSG